MALQDILTAADDRLDAYWPDFVSGQEDYLSRVGRYWQGLRSHSNAPTDGNESTVDNAEVTPSDVGLDWSGAIQQFGLDLSLTWLQALTVDSVKAEGGDAFVVTRELEYNGTLYVTARAHDPSAVLSPSRTYDWRRAEPIPDAPQWEGGISYEVGDTVTYESVAYECIQAHTSQEGWEPPNVPSLWEAP